MFVVLDACDQTICFMRHDGVATFHPSKAAHFRTYQEARAAADKQEGWKEALVEVYVDDGNDCYCWGRCTETEG